jgi:hypothetical protein
MDPGWEYIKVQYVLITSNGRRMVFHVLACAEVYRIIHGGQIHCVKVKYGDEDD